MRSRPTAARAGASGLVIVAIAVFIALLALMSVRLADGRDPALRARAAAAPLPPRRILIRRIYERRVIVQLPATAPPQRATSAQQAGSVAPYGAASLLTRTS